MAYTVTLKNDISFSADIDKTIFDSARDAGVTLDHSCLMARCMSCKAKVLTGSCVDINEEKVLSDEERAKGYILTCNTKPKSDIKLDIEDLGDIQIQKSRTLPCKIDTLEKMTDDVIKLVLRLPPNTDFKFLAGQYINLIRGGVKRSYSIAGTTNKDSQLEFYIKRYNEGQMSSYLFNSAKENDLLRLEGPLGTFFLRESETIERIVFLATGTGIAPIKAILEYLIKERNFSMKRILLFWGGRKSEDFFWNLGLNYQNIEYIPVLSRKDDTWDGEFGYVQNVLINRIDDFSKTQVYACGSNNMIKDSKKLLLENGLLENNFYSDAFVNSN